MFDKNNYKQKMNKTFEAFIKDLLALRTGRANVNMLDDVLANVRVNPAVPICLRIFRARAGRISTAAL